MLKNRIKDKREELGYSQEKAAFLVGISRNALGSIERGEAIPSLKIAFKLSYLFKVTIEELFYFENQ